MAKKDISCKFPDIIDGTLCVVIDIHHKKTQFKNALSIVSYDGLNDFKVKFDDGRVEDFKLDNLKCELMFYCYNFSQKTIRPRHHSISIINRILYIYTANNMKNFTISSALLLDIADATYSGDDEYYLRIKFKNGNICDYFVWDDKLIGRDGIEHDISFSGDFYCLDGKMVDVDVKKCIVTKNNTFLVQTTTGALYKFDDLTPSRDEHGHTIVDYFRMCVLDKIAILYVGGRIIDSSDEKINVNFTTTEPTPDIYEIAHLLHIVGSRFWPDVNKIYPLVLNHNIYAISDFGAIYEVGTLNIYAEWSNVTDLEQVDNILTIVTDTDIYTDVDIAKISGEKLMIAQHDKYGIIAFWSDPHRQIIKCSQETIYRADGEYYNAPNNKIVPIGEFPRPNYVTLFVNTIQKFGDYGYKINDILILNNIVTEIADIAYGGNFGVYKISITFKSGDKRNCCLAESTLYEERGLVFECGEYVSLMYKSGEYYSPLGKFEPALSAEKKNNSIYNIGGDIVAFAEAGLRNLKIYQLHRYYLAVSGSHAEFGKIIVNRGHTKTKCAA